MIFNMCFEALLFMFINFCTSLIYCTAQGRLFSLRKQAMIRGATTREFTAVASFLRLSSVLRKRKEIKLRPKCLG